MNVPLALLDVDTSLKRMEKLLPHYTLTLVARYTGEKDLKDADIVLTRDDLDKAIAAIENLKKRDPILKAGDATP